MDIFNQVMFPVIVILLSILAFWFAIQWRNDRAYQRKRADREYLFQRKEKEKARQEAAEVRHSEEMRAYEEREYRREELERQEERIKEQQAGAGTGGYIFLDLAEPERAIFHDLLKGFEEYAELKGYKINFSIDATFGEKIAFKFTPAPDAINVSPAMVKADFQEYLLKVDSGATLDDLPIILPPEEHALLLTKMKNRISLLQHSYNLEKNLRIFLADLLGKIHESRMLPAPNFYVQGGGQMSPKNYSAVNSQRLIQGDHNDYQDNSVDSSIHIANSFNERADQIEKISKLIELLKEDKTDNIDEKEQAIVNLEKVKDELTNEDQPDKSRIEKWLGRVKTGVEIIKAGKPVVEAAIEVFKSFGWSDLSTLAATGMS